MSTPATAQPHDLLWGMPVAHLPAEAPAWVIEVIDQGHPVVVRRARVAPQSVAVGVRGRSRDQRYGTAMKCVDISRRIGPEDLVGAVDDRPVHWPALRALKAIRPVMDAIGLPWGVTGSAGFELATGIAVLHQGSDLDLILRASEFFSRRRAAELVQALEGGGVSYRSATADPRRRSGAARMGRPCTPGVAQIR